MYEISPYHVVLAGFGVAIILAYWLPRFFSGREPAASALLIGLGALLFGWLPGVGEALDPVSSPAPWEIASELCLIIGLFGVGLRIDNLTNLKRWTPTLRLLAIAMPLTILAVAVAGIQLAGMTIAGALLLGAVLAPTDPVLAGDVQVGPPTEGGEHPVRFTLTTEAGLNDGLAFPFVHLALAVAAAGALTPSLAAEWVTRDVVYRIAAGTAGGVFIGWLLGQLLFRHPKGNALAETQSGVVALAGVFVVYGVTELAEGYGFIAAFVAGLTLRRVESHHDFHVRLHDFSENIEHALMAVLLIAFGAAMQALLSRLDWAGTAICLLLILVVRPLIGWLSLQGALLTGRRRLVAAIYGVRGVGSIYYLAYAGSHIELQNEEALLAVVVFTVLLSTILHGFTAALAVEKATGSKQAE